MKRTKLPKIGKAMLSVKASQIGEMSDNRIALLRLAARELEGASAACEMFLQHAHKWTDGQSAIAQEEQAIATIEYMRAVRGAEAIQKKADELRERLEIVLFGFEGLEVDEIE